MGLFERLRAEPVYNTRAVARLTGVPADTFRAWERRYGVPHPSRTEGNHRLYSERDIATIRWLRDQTTQGLTISQAVALLPHRPASPSTAPGQGLTGAANGSADTNDSESRDPLVSLRQQAAEALIGFDSTGAERLIEEALALLPVEDVCLHLLRPILVDIGERWHRGEITVSAEHYASGFVIRKLGSLFNLSQPSVGQGPIVAACVEGELHEVGLLLTCLFLSRRGYRIVYLGPNLPLPDLLDAVSGIRPPLVLLAASTRVSATRLAESAKAIRQQSLAIGLGTSPVVGYGGSIFVTDRSLREPIDGLFLGDEADEAVEAVARVVHPAL